MQALARKRGGRCLSATYVNSYSNLRWRCAKGHEWEARPSSIKSIGTWCPKCSGRKLGTIKEMQVLAKKHKGKCLSSTYVNANSKLRWRCAKGHEWEAAPEYVKYAGYWCSKCSDKNLIGTIEDMRTLAKKYKGECLSKIYKGAHNKLRWRCAKGHKWESTPSNVKNGGYWCPECRKDAKRKRRKG